MVEGYGFSSGEDVTFLLSGSTGVSVTTTTAGSDGSIEASFVIPPSTPAGTYVLTATGGTSGDTASATMDLPFLGLTPSSGGIGQNSIAAPTFKWSRDNGIVVSSISYIDTSSSTATVLTVGSTGKNPNLSFLANMWVEVTSDINDLWGLPGTLALVTAVNSPAQNTITIDPTSIVGSAITDIDYPPELHPKIRRWDWDQVTSTPPPYPLPVQVPADNDGYIELEDGVEVRFTGGTYKTGDYWLVPARTATADVDWPERVTAVNWAAVPSGGSDAASLAAFLTQRYGLDGIGASDFTASSSSEIDASYNDPSGVLHNLSIALNDDQTDGTLTVDGIVGAQIPVLTESDGTLLLQCGFPDALWPEGIEHYHSRLALLGYEPVGQVSLRLHRHGLRRGVDEQPQPGFGLDGPAVYLPADRDRARRARNQRGGRDQRSRDE